MSANEIVFATPTPFIGIVAGLLNWILPLLAGVFAIAIGVLVQKRRPVVVAVFSVFAIAAIASPYLDVLQPKAMSLLLFWPACTRSLAEGRESLSCIPDGAVQPTVLYAAGLVCLPVMCMATSGYLLASELHLALKEGFTWWTCAIAIGFAGVVVLTWTRFGLWKGLVLI